MAQNLALIDPFNAYSPQVVDALLNDDGSAGVVTNLAFSGSGSWLATATVNLGLTVAIWDLFSCSKAYTFERVNLEKQGKLVFFKWNGNVHIIAANMTGEIFVFNPHQGKIPSRFVATIDGADELISVFPYNSMGNFLVCHRSGKVCTVNGECLRPGNPVEKDQVVACAWHESGILFLATAKNVLGFDVFHKKELMYEHDSCFGSNFIIQSIAIDPAANRLAVALKDKSIRIVDCTVNREEARVKFSHRHKLHDVVNKWPWSVFGFSQDGELVWGTFTEKSRHLVYLWDANVGTLVKILDGPKEDLLTAAWNPRKPYIITGGIFGTLFRWVPDYPTKWSALVPGLEEIEENVEYMEREDEFDLPVEEELSRKKQEAIMPIDEPIDVITRDVNSIVVELIPLSLGRS